MAREPRLKPADPMAASVRGSSVEGFGFDPSESGHHFRVTIPAKKDERVYISEHFSADDSRERLELNIALGAEDDKLRAILPRLKWDDIADATQVEFNQRLRQMNVKPGKWKVGATPISRLFGKELVLLAWAVEDADPALIPAAVRNWLGLVPEERWWLFTMTNAATGRIGKDVSTRAFRDADGAIRRQANSHPRAEAASVAVAGRNENAVGYAVRCLDRQIVG